MAFGRELARFQHWQFTMTDFVSRLEPAQFVLKVATRADDGFHVRSRSGHPGGHLHRTGRGCDPDRRNRLSASMRRRSYHDDRRSTIDA
jgi:hypothetical protein